MAICYCDQCQRAMSDRFIKKIEGRLLCPKCREALLDLGQEASEVSSLKKLYVYDLTHQDESAKPVSASEISKIYRDPAIETEILECEDALTHHADNIEAMLHVAKLYQTLNQLDLALGYYDRVLKFVPQHQEALQRRIDILYHLQRYDAAIASLKVLITMAQDSAYLYFNLGILYLYAKKRMAAYRAFRHGFQLTTSMGFKQQIRSVVFKHFQSDRDKTNFSL